MFRLGLPTLALVAFICQLVESNASQVESVAKRQSRVQSCLRTYSQTYQRGSWFDICTSNQGLSNCNANSFRSTCSPSRYYWILFQFSNFQGPFVYVPPNTCYPFVNLPRVSSVLRCTLSGGFLNCQYPFGGRGAAASSAPGEPRAAGYQVGGGASQPFSRVSLSDVQAASRQEGPVPTPPTPSSGPRRGRRRGRGRRN